jgi:hypothetical protein
MFVEPGFSFEAPHEMPQPSATATVARPRRAEIRCKNSMGSLRLPLGGVDLGLGLGGGPQARPSLLNRSRCNVELAYRKPHDTKRQACRGPDHRGHSSSASPRRP